MISKIEQGSTAEEAARRHLEQQGLKLIERNYVCRVGELDLIMQDGVYLVFVEVRSRQDSRYGTPAETVTRAKQKRLVRAAAYYLQRRRINPPCRFDVIAISQTGDSLDLQWIKDAFQAL